MEIGLEHTHNVEYSLNLEHSLPKPNEHIKPFPIERVSKAIRSNLITSTFYKPENLPYEEWPLQQNLSLLKGPQKQSYNIYILKPENLLYEEWPLKQNLSLLKGPQKQSYNIYILKPENLPYKEWPVQQYTPKAFVTLPTEQSPVHTQHSVPSFNLTLCWTQ